MAEIERLQNFINSYNLIQYTLLTTFQKLLNSHAKCEVIVKSVFVHIFLFLWGFFWNSDQIFDNTFNQEYRILFCV